MAGGKISQLIRMLNQLPDEQSDALLKRLFKEQPLVAIRIIQQHFSFEDLLYASEQGLHEIVDSVSEDVLVTALVGAEDGLIRRFLSAFGTGRARTFSYMKTPSVRRRTVTTPPKPPPVAVNGVAEPNTELEP